MRYIWNNLSIDVDYGTPDDCANKSRLWTQVVHSPLSADVNINLQALSSTH